MSPIVLWSIVGSLIAIVVVIYISIYTGIIDLPEKITTPEPLPPSDGKDYDFLPEYIPGENIYDGVDNNLPTSDDLGYDNYCGNLGNLNESKDPDMDCRLCLGNINEAKEEGKKDNLEYVTCPYQDSGLCQSCYFKANVVSDPRECGGSWVITGLDIDSCKK